MLTKLLAGYAAQGDRYDELLASPGAPRPHWDAFMIRDSVIDWQELSSLYERADVLDAAGLAAFLRGLREQEHRLLSQLERMPPASPAPACA